MKKNVVIIGGSSGIGMAASKFFLEKEDFVANLSRSKSLLQGATNFEFDASEISNIKAKIDEICASIGQVDILVYSAGFSMASPMEKVKKEDYKYLFNTNLIGVIEVIRCIMPYLKKFAHIVVVSSIGGVVPIYYDAFYSASKAALNMLVVAMQGELRKKDVYISAILPGGTQTDFTFKRKVYPFEQMGLYAADMQTAVKTLANTEQNGASANKVGKDIVKIAYSSKPPILFCSGFINKFYYFLSKILPLKWIRKMCKINYFGK